MFGGYTVGVGFTPARSAERPTVFSDAYKMPPRGTRRRKAGAYCPFFFGAASVFTTHAEYRQ